MPNVHFLGSLTGQSAAVGPIVALAPMSGITDVAFRRLAARFGADLVVTEMVAASAYVAGAEEARLRSEGVGVSPHVVQLVGRDPARMADAARLAEASGADALDINMGCPAKRVVGGLAGSALMREPDLALALVAAVAKAVAIPVTVKMRLGWDDASRNAPDIARRSEEAGASGFAVHGRTRQQFYKGVADWRAISAVVAATTRPVLANGDIADLAGARACLERSGAAGIMIGRAAMGQPWLLGEVSARLRGEAWVAPGLDARAAAALEHYEALLGMLGREIGMRHARKHLAAYAECARQSGFGLGPADTAELLTSLEPERVRALLARLYDQPIRRAA